MGLLDRMLADLVGKSVGVNPRMVRRLIRGKSGTLLAMGAGAAIASALERKGHPTPNTMGAGQAPGGPPPPPGAAQVVPPPPPGAAPVVPPPLPTSPDGQRTATAAPDPAEPSNEVLYPLLRTMVAAAMADGSLDPAERRTIEERLDESDLDDARRQRVRDDLATPPDTAELAGLSADTETRAAMYRVAGLVVLADGRVDTRERAWLDELAAALSFDAGTKAELEAEIFADT